MSYPWVTSHVSRKTAATLLDEAGKRAKDRRSARALSGVSGAGSLPGHKITSVDAARVLEIIGRAHQAEVIGHVANRSEG
jgi:hypothetical protein